MRSHLTSSSCANLPRRTRAARRAGVPAALAFPAVALAAAVAFAPRAAAAPQGAGAPTPVPAPGTTLTIYSSADPAGFDPRQFVDQARAGGGAAFASQVPGFGVVRDVRMLEVKEMDGGRLQALMTDVAQFMDPTTVSFTDLTDPATQVRNQAFQFDLVSPEKLLEKYLGRPITVSVTEGMQPRSVSGTLLSATGGRLVLQGASGVQIVPAHAARVELANLPAGLLTRPTLVWDLTDTKTGPHLVQLAYQTAGLTWRADYNLVVNADDTSADLGAWVTILNLSGAGWKDAGLKLVAGDVNKVQPPERTDLLMLGVEAGTAGPNGGFQEKTFFEYHLYTLPRRTDVLANSSQQLVLFPTATQVPVTKLMVMQGGPEYGGWGPQTDRAWGAGEKVNVQVFFRFTNSRASRLGVPLPAGKVRLYKADSDGSLEFIGEDVIGHTAREEKVLVKAGNAFDVVGERTQVDFSLDTGRKEMTESIRVEVRNRKDAPATVVVRERLARWSGWEITARSQDFRKINASTIEFDVPLAANETKSVTYTVKYRW
ncbi:MAG: DUF4139 domain-containing protein [Phycisphaerales bacterium]